MKEALTITGESRKVLLRGITNATTEYIYSDPVSPPCGHTEEREELERWRETSSTCPRCRTPIKESDIKANFELIVARDAILQVDPFLKRYLYISPKKVAQLVGNADVKGLVELYKAKPSRINNPVKNTGPNLLQLVLRTGNLEFIKAFFENFKNEIDINATVPNPENQYQSLLMFVCLLKKKEIDEAKQATIIKFLLEQGANPALVGADEQSPLLATILQHKSLCVEALLDSKLDLKINANSNNIINKVINPAGINNYNGYTALMAAIDTDLELVLFERLLAIPGISVNHKNKADKSALYMAAETGKLPQTKALLAMPGIDAEALHTYEETVEKKKVVKSITAGRIAEVNKHEKVAALFRTPEVCFISAKNKFDRGDFRGAGERLSAIYLAGVEINSYLAEMKKAYQEKADYSAFCRELLSRIIKAAIQKNDTQLILNLLKDAPLVTLFDIQGTNILALAAAGGSLPVVKMLLENLSDVKVDQVDKDDNTALHLAANGPQGGNDEIVKYLLGKNANPLLVNKQGKLPLEIALGINNKFTPQNKVIDVLLDAHIKLHQVNNIGKFYPLLELARKGNFDNFMKLLSCKETDINITNGSGETALLKAILAGNYQKVQTLLSTPGIDILDKLKNRKIAIDLSPDALKIKALFDCHKLAVGILENKTDNHFSLDCINQMDAEMFTTVFQSLKNNGYGVEKCQWFINFLSELQSKKANGKYPLHLFKETKETIEADLELLNRFFVIAHKSYRYNNEDWEYKVRRKAVEWLKAETTQFNDREQAEILISSLKAPIIDMQRNWYAFWPTQAKRDITERIEFLNEKINQQDELTHLDLAVKQQTKPRASK